jgi:hypothetical protein
MPQKTPGWDEEWAEVAGEVDVAEEEQGAGWEEDRDTVKVNGIRLHPKIESCSGRGIGYTGVCIMFPRQAR